MKRELEDGTFFESRLRINLADKKKCQEKLSFCKQLGIKNVIIEPRFHNQLINANQKTALQDRHDLNIFFRINLKLDDVKAFKKQVQKFNGFPHIISVESRNKDVHIHAARDSRVDIVSFSHPKVLPSLTSGVISLVKQNGSFIEFSLGPIMGMNKRDQSRNFRNLYKSLKRARKHKVNFIVSGNFKKKFDMRHPRALISIINTLLDVMIQEAKNVCKIHPRKLISRATNRSNGDVMEPGVKLITEEGK